MEGKRFNFFKRVFKIKLNLVLEMFIVIVFKIKLGTGNVERKPFYDFSQKNPIRYPLGTLRRFALQKNTRPNITPHQIFVAAFSSKALRFLISTRLTEFSQSNCLTIQTTLNPTNLLCVH